MLSSRIMKRCHSKVATKTSDPVHLVALEAHRLRDLAEILVQELVVSRVIFILWVMEARQEAAEAAAVVTNGPIMAILEEFHRPQPVHNRAKLGSIKFFIQDLQSTCCARMCSSNKQHPVLKYIHP